MIVDNPFSLKSKTVLVTGASSGIGRATAMAVSKMGADVIMVGRDKTRLLDTLESSGNGNNKVIFADLTSDSDINHLISELEPLDGVVLCAGKGKTLPIKFCDRKHFNEIFDVNFFSTVELLRQLVKNKKLKRGSSVVVISSMGGTHVYSVGNSIYGSSKAALDSFVKYAAREYAIRDVRVNSICPARIESPLLHSGLISEDKLIDEINKYPLKRYGTPEEVANAAVFLLSEASSWITGTSLIIDGGLSLIL